MFPYIVLLLIPFICLYVAKPSETAHVQGWKIGNSKYIKDNNLALSAFFLLYFIILALRDTRIGRDVFAYEIMFNEYAELYLKELLEQEGDKLYVLLNWIIGIFTDNFQIFLSVVAAMTLYPVYKQYNRDKRHSFIKIVLFMNMTVFIMFFSGLRQSLAIATGMIAYEFVRSKKIIPFIIIVVIAIGFHHSAFVLFLMYPLYYWRLKKKSLLFIIPTTVVIYVFNKPIFIVLSTIMNMLAGGQYETEIKDTGAITMIVLLALFLALAYIIPDEKLMDSETLGLRNYLMMALWMQLFAPLHTLAMRFNYYYIIFVPMVIPKILVYSSKKYKKLAKIAGIVITVYLLYYYLKNTYRACITGISALDTYPYIPFWRG